MKVSHIGAIAGLVMGLSVAPSATALTLTRYPSVWLQTTTSITIAWQTDLPATGKVLYGINSVFENEATHAGMATDHAVALSGLTPASQYRFRIISGTDTLTLGDDTFRTAPATSEPFRMLAFGDLGAATPEQIQMAARIEALNGDFAILTGDIIYEGGEAANFTPQYFNIYRPTIAKIPFYSSLGNHDVVTANGQPYLDAFYFPTANSGTERYYSFDYSNAHIVALEVTLEDIAPGAAMLNWLASDLAATSKHWKFVFFHVPMYSNLAVHGDDPTIAGALGPIFDAAGVDLVFQGHNHFYTRTYPILGGVPVSTAQEPFYTNPGAPIYFVTGGAGRFLHALSPLTSREAISRSTYHAMYVDVDGVAITLAAVERDGTQFDVMTLWKDTPTAVELVPVVGSRAGPYRFAALHARPNPSDGNAEIGYTLDRVSDVRVSLFNVAGRLVRVLEKQGPLGPGPHAAHWDGMDRSGRTTPAGLYLARIQSENRSVWVRILRIH